MWEEFKTWLIKTARAVGGAVVCAYNSLVRKVEQAARIVASNPDVKKTFRLVVDQALAKGVAAATMFLNAVLPGLGAVFKLSIEILLDFIFGKSALATA